MLNIDYDKLLNELNLEKILEENFVKKLKMSEEDAKKLTEEIINRGLDESKTIVDKALYEMASRKR